MAKDQNRRRRGEEAVNKYQQNLNSPGASAGGGSFSENPGAPGNPEEDEGRENPAHQEEDPLAPESGGEGYEDYSPGEASGEGEGSPSPGDASRPMVERVEFPPLTSREDRGVPVDLDTVGDISLNVSAELGTAHLKVRDLLNLEEGSVLKLNRLADETIHLLVNETLFARGEVVVINERFGVRVVSFLGEQERDEELIRSRENESEAQRSSSQEGSSGGEEPGGSGAGKKEEGQENA